MMMVMMMTRMPMMTIIMFMRTTDDDGDYDDMIDDDDVAFRHARVTLWAQVFVLRTSICACVQAYLQLSRRTHWPASRDLCS